MEKLNLLSRLDSVSTRFLINTLDKADPRGVEHAFCVAEVSYALGRILDHDRYSADELWLAGLVHDVGLLGIPKEITDKKGKLTNKQRKYMEQHTKLSKFIIDHLFEAPEISRAVLCHHERPDGKGYPLKLDAEDIPFMARVVAVADCYDAMRSAHWLLLKKSHNSAVAELRENAGAQFDRDVIKAFHLNHDPICVAYDKAQSMTVKELLKRI